MADFVVGRLCCYTVRGRGPGPPCAPWPGSPIGTTRVPDSSLHRSARRRGDGRARSWAGAAAASTRYTGVPIRKDSAMRLPRVPPRARRIALTLLAAIGAALVLWRLHLNEPVPTLPLPAAEPPHEQPPEAGALRGRGR